MIKILGEKYTVLYIITFVVIIFTFLVSKNDVIYSEEINILVQLVSILLFFILCLVLLNIQKINFRTSSLTKLSIIVIVYSLPVSLLILVILLFQTGDYFPYRGTDQIYYHEQAIKYLNYSHGEFITHFFENQRWWDIGTVYYVRSLYLIWDSPLAIRLFNIIILVLSAAFVYKIGIQFMSKKYSVMATILYSLSSFSTYIVVSSNKEHLLVMTVIITAYLLIRFVKTSRYKYLFWLVIPLLLLSFLRPYLIGFFVLATLISFVIDKRKSLTKYNAIIISVVGIILILPQIFIAYRRFFGTYETFLLVNQDLFIHSLSITILFSLFISFIGPLPTLVAISPNEGLAFYAPGLFFRNMIGLLFIISCYISIRKREVIILPIVLFSLMEMVSLGLLLESFELRKAYPHFSFIYLIALYLIYKIEYKILPIKRIAAITRLNNYYLTILMIVIIAWNLRYYYG